jgi:hypothetical protein
VLHADVVRGDVEDQPDVALARRPAQGHQRLVAAEVPCHVLVVDDVVAVVRARLEDRVQVERVHTDVREMVEVRLDPGQVAAVELDERSRASNGQLVPGSMPRRLATIGPGAVRDVVRRVAVREAVGKDLVDHAVVQPARRVVAGQEDEILAIGGHRPVQPGRVQPAVAVGRVDEKSVVRRRRGQAELGLPPATGWPRRPLLERSEDLLSVGRRPDVDPVDRDVQACADAEADAVADAESVEIRPVRGDHVPARAVVVDGADRHSRVDRGEGIELLRHGSPGSLSVMRIASFAGDEGS